MKLKLLCLVLALGLCAAAQTTMVGLPQHGVALTGDGTAPVVVNHSGKAILGVSLKFLEEGVKRPNAGPNYDVTLITNPLPDGEQMIVVGFGTKPNPNASPVNGNRLMGGTSSPVTKVILDGLLFVDGTFVGPDKEGLSDRMATKLKITASIGSQVVSGAMTWEQVRAAAAVEPTSHTTQALQTQDIAQRLIQAYDKFGEGIALNLAARFAALPTLNKQ